MEEGVVVDWGGEGGPERISVRLSDESDLFVYKEGHLSRRSIRWMLSIPWNVRLRKDHEVRRIVRCFTDQTDGFGDCRFGV